LAPPISTDNIINLNDDLPLNLSNLPDPADVGLDPSVFQNIYSMGSVTSSSIGTSPSPAFFTPGFSRNRIQGLMPGWHHPSACKGNHNSLNEQLSLKTNQGESKEKALRSPD
jgi:hypothetical protein